jgi:putative toxin-antitoxin system antitoxin component (TIGR02293 family)
MARTQTAPRAGSKGQSGGHETPQLTMTKKKAPRAPAIVKTVVVREKPTIGSVTGSPSSRRFKLTKDELVMIYEAPALMQVEWVKRGIGARDAKGILKQLRIPQGEVLTALHIPAATVNRKVRSNAPLSPAEGERVLGFGRLLGQIQSMVRDSGNPEGFDASAWLSSWMKSPVPALGGARPLDLMDTMTGQALVSQMLAQMQSGAYA